jgi:hypothetical protein
MGIWGRYPPSHGFHSICKWMKLIYWLCCYGCIFHGTGNSAQLWQYFGMSGGFNKFSWGQRAERMGIWRRYPPSHGFRSICKWMKLIYWLSCYGCIHGTGNSSQLWQNFGISGGGWTPPSVRHCKPSERPCAQPALFCELLPGRNVPNRTCTPLTHLTTCVLYVPVCTAEILLLLLKRL